MLHICIIGRQARKRIGDLIPVELALVMYISGQGPLGMTLQFIQSPRV
jgi:hypothetical protein